MSTRTDKRTSSSSRAIILADAAVDIRSKVDVPRRFRRMSKEHGSPQQREPGWLSRLTDEVASVARGSSGRVVRFAGVDPYPHVTNSNWLSQIKADPGVLESALSGPSRTRASDRAPRCGFSAGQIERHVNDHVFLAADHAPMSELDEDFARIDVVVFGRTLGMA